MTHTPWSSQGRPVTGNQIDPLAHETEAGYDPATLRRSGGRKPMNSAAAKVLPVRLDPELDAVVRQRALADHSTAGDVVRDALHAWLRSA